MPTNSRRLLNPKPKVQDQPDPGGLGRKNENNNMNSTQRWLAVALLATLNLGWPRSAFADDPQDDIQALRKQIQELDQKVRILERKHELDQEVAVKTKKESPKLTANADQGFSFASPDNAFKIRFRGLIQGDARTFVGGDNAVQGSSANNVLLLRRARPIIEGTVFKDFDFKFVPDFGGSSVVIQDAYLTWNIQPWLALRGGKFKAPVGLELLQEDAFTFFNERALPTNLVPNRDIGFQIQGKPLDGVLDYQAGVFNGVADGANTTNTDSDDNREFIARLFALPFKKTGLDLLKGLGVGVGGGWGNETGSGVNALPSGYKTDGQQTFFSYLTGAGTAASPNVVADGAHWRLAPQAYWYYGPYGLLGEYTFSSQYLRRNAGAVVDRLQADNTAWQLAAGWVITGEDVTFNGVKPRNDFNLSKGNWGALQLVARYSELHLDNGLFSNWASSTSTDAARSWATGVNWYLNKFVRIGVDYSQTEFGRQGAGNNTLLRDGEKVVLTRFQLAF